MDTVHCGHKSYAGQDSCSLQPGTNSTNYSLYFALLGKWDRGIQYQTSLITTSFNLWYIGTKEKKTTFISQNGETSYSIIDEESISLLSKIQRNGDERVLMKKSSSPLSEKCEVKSVL